jgi:hypothetical protein
MHVDLCVQDFGQEMRNRSATDSQERGTTKRAEKYYSKELFLQGMIHRGRGDWS